MKKNCNSLTVLILGIFLVQFSIWIYNALHFEKINISYEASQHIVSYNDEPKLFLVITIFSGIGILYLIYMFMKFLKCKQEQKLLRKNEKRKQTKTNKIQIGFNWGLALFFIALFGLLNILGIETDLKANFDMGIILLSISITGFLIIKYFFIWKEDDISNMFICTNCEEAYDKKNLKKNMKCLNCGNNLDKLEGFYKNKKNNIKTISSHT